ncbi:hypothetical protein MPSEU_001073900 [Mayamaea pseudoterrestris]|nr:hypothetical protein MPSEU_001073900 [Mayamaea pseudoterrestris]
MTSLSFVKDIQKQAKQGPELEKCEDLLEKVESELKRHTIKADRAAMLAALTSLQKSIRALKRHASKADGQRWKSLLEKMDTAKSLANEIQAAETVDEEQGNESLVDDEQQQETTDTHGDSKLPGSLSEYTSRLKKQKKELYKNPPVMPPGKIAVHDKQSPLPKRDSKGRLVFEAGESKSIAPILKDFYPNQTPEQVLRAGAFGGTYFRTITSAVTNETYNGEQALYDTVPSEWIEGLDIKKMLTSDTYDVSINKYGVKCGGSLGMWESSGWISEIDPYGWFQWYCRFYQGRRCSDDFRQVSRWLKIAGPKGRFKSQLCNKIMAANAKAEDASISPVIRQTLFHWGLLVDDAIVEAHRKSH